MEIYPKLNKKQNIEILVDNKDFGVYVQWVFTIFKREFSDKISGLKKFALVFRAKVLMIWHY